MYLSAVIPPLPPPKLLLPLAACASLVALLLRLMQRVRAARDRRHIRSDLEKRRCTPISIRRTRGRGVQPALAGPGGGAATAAITANLRRAYDVVFIDLEGDHGEGVCYLGRGQIRWNEDGIGPGVMLQVAGADLPEYGQNWRG